jgi:hypothetical protein
MGANPLYTNSMIDSCAFDPMAEVLRLQLFVIPTEVGLQVARQKTLASRLRGDGSGALFVTSFRRLLLR